MSETELRPVECLLVAADAVLRSVEWGAAVLLVLAAQLLLGCAVFLARLWWVGLVDFCA